MPTYLLIITSLIMSLSCGKQDSQQLNSSSQEQQIEDLGIAHLSPPTLDKDAKIIEYKSPMPAADSKFYLSISKKDDQGKKIYSVSANTLIIKKGHEQGIWELFNNRQDIKQVTLNAETIIVNDKVKIPVEILEIQADKLVFKPGGTIDVTPTPFLPARPTESGKDYTYTPELKIFANQFETAAKDQIVFIADGAKGQDAGPGVPGKNGRRVPVIKNKNVIFKCITVLDIPRDFSTYMNTANPQSTNCGREKILWPTNGQDAKPPGMPGRGGNGGVVISSIKNLDQHISIKAGSPGLQAEDVPGGTAGRPNPAIAEIDSRKETRRYSKGSDGKAPIVNMSELRGEEGQFYYADWPSFKRYDSSLTKMRLDYIEDLYRSGHAQKAFDLLVSLKSLSQKYQKSNPIVEKEIAKMSKMESRLRRGLDFFGQKRATMPTLSFETQTLVFRSEVKRYINYLAFYEWLKRAQYDQQQLKQELENQQADLYEQIESVRSKYASSIRKLPTLEVLKNEISAQEGEVKIELERVESELIKRAKRNANPYKASTFKKILSTASALASVVPAGQPATGLISTSLSAISNLQRADGSFNPSALPSVVSTLTTDYKIEESSRDWNEKYAKFRLSNLKELSSEDLKDRLKEMYQFSKPMIEAIKEQSKVWQRPTLQQSTFTRELNKLKKEDVLYQDLVKKIKKLVEKRVAYESELAKILDTISSSQHKITEYVAEIHQLNSDSAIANNKIHPKVLEMIEKRLKNYEYDVAKYHAYMASAYQYRMLSPYPKTLNLKRIKGLVKNLVREQRGSQISLKDLQKIEALYTEQLSTILDEILVDFSERGREHTKTVRFSLSNAEKIALSKGDSIYLDLSGDHFILDGEQDARISDVRVGRVQIKSEYSSEILITHLGSGVLEKNGKKFLFRYKNDKNKSPFLWGAHLSSNGSYVSNYSPSVHQKNLFLTFIDQSIGQNGANIVSLFTRPAAKAGFKVELLGQGQKELQDLDIEIEYTFFR